MNKKSSLHKPILLGLLLACLFILACEGDTIYITAPEALDGDRGPSWLFVHNATSGTLDLAGGFVVAPAQGAVYTLTLAGVSPHTTLFSNSPERQAKTILTRDFVDNWHLGDFGFLQDPPNAAIELLTAPLEKNVLIVELTNPVYENGNLIYMARPVDESLVFLQEHWGKTAHHEAFPSAFQDVALFLDSTTTTQNTCTSYTPYWLQQCPDGERCITFTNNCADTIYLSYQVGCNSDGTAGSPQCNCTPGPVLQSGGTVYWQIVDGNYAPGSASYAPACLTEGLTVMANKVSSTCAQGTRIEFTAGNSADPYGKFDSYNISTQGNAGGDWYSVPVSYTADITCNHTVELDCRPLYCDSLTCPDAYLTSTTGGCADNRSPQGNCQDTFGNFGTQAGFTVEFCPATCNQAPCASCQTMGQCN